MFIDLIRNKLRNDIVSHNNTVNIHNGYTDINVNYLKFTPKLVNSGSSLTVDYTLSSYWDITVNANTILNFVNGVDGAMMYVNIKQDSAGGRTISYSGSVYLKYIPSTPNASVLYEMKWYKNRWVANVIYSIDIFNTNMLTQQWRQNPFKDTTVNNITGWTTGPSLPDASYMSHAIVTKNRVYLLGGKFDTPVTSTTSTIYTAPINSDGTLGSWTTGPSLRVALYASQAIVTKNRVYLLGGHNGLSVVSTVYTAPINSDGTLGTWTTGTSLPSALSASQAIVTKNRVYLLRGHNGSSAVSTVYTAPINSDGTLGTWTTGTSLPSALYDSQAIVTKNRVYLLGGWNGSSAVSLVYTAPINSDGTLGTWTTGTSLPGALYASQAIVTKNRVYLLGGSTGSTIVSSVYTAPINSDGTLGTWTTGTSLPDGLRYSEAIVTKNRVYLLGGNIGASIVSSVYTAPFADGWEWQDPHSAYYEDNGINP